MRKANPECTDGQPIKAIELVGDVDVQHRLQAEMPLGVPIGQVRFIVLLPNENEGGRGWSKGIAVEWSDDLSDTTQDIYTLEDGQPMTAPR